MVGMRTPKRHLRNGKIIKLLTQLFFWISVLVCQLAVNVSSPHMNLSEAIITGPK